MLIEISKPGTLHLANLTVPGLDLVVDVAHVVPQRRRIEELQLTLRAWLSFLSLVVIPPDVSQQIFGG